MSYCYYELHASESEENQSEPEPTQSQTTVHQNTHRASKETCHMKQWPHQKLEHHQQWHGSNQNDHQLHQRSRKYLKLQTSQENFHRESIYHPEKTTCLKSKYQ
jgi:hypothetical protein